MRRSEKNKKPKKTKRLKKIMFFIIFELIFCSLLSVYLVFYGPFTNIKETIVTSAMTTLKHKYLASLFLSKDQIDKILENNKSEIRAEDENQEDIVVNKNGNGNVQLINIETKKFNGYLLIVEDPSRITVGTSENLGEHGATLSQIVKRYGAAGGVNAGGFSDKHMTGTGGIPSGIIIENHDIKYVDDNQNKFDIVGFNDKDILVIGNYTLKQIKKMKLRDAISFGPPLIINGNPMITKGDGGWGIAPRTAIAQRKDGSVILLVIDGRQASSIGATLKDVQNVLLKYDAYNAVNLDGGSSATMYYNNSVINSPSDIMGERLIPSAFIIKGVN